ncbi:Uncharacterized protein dnl_24750 [Desulfonema limicola]|uniref:Uncharacterized protein n=1 Tax=Desulfonema limicola TaxID=45656 RepID=A0A975B7A9_9BACT|nr:hypothetical protein [Desulfonema limicola]QTA80182.1 Uncharacterized protein dnl_24750 [Desulfonema limicola]
MQTMADENKLRQILKDAIVEAVQERKDIFYDLIAEIIEDIAMANAIKEGENSEKVSRDEVFAILEGQL